MKLSDLLKMQQDEMESLLIKRNADLIELKRIQGYDTVNLGKYEGLSEKLDKNYQIQIKELLVKHEEQRQHYFPEKKAEPEKGKNMTYNQKVTVEISTMKVEPKPEPKTETQEERVARKLAAWKSEREKMVGRRNERGNERSR